MFGADFAVYLGKERTDGFCGFVAEDNFFLALEIEEGLTSEQGQQIIQKIIEESKNLQIESLTSFDGFISNLITKHNIPASFSVSTGYLQENKLYLKTVGKGMIFIKRKAELAKIIESDNSASGFVEAGDFFIFTSDRFINLIGSDIELKGIFQNKNPQQIASDLTTRFKEKDDKGTLTLFLQFNEQKQEILEENAATPIISKQKGSLVGDLIKKSKDLFVTFRAYSDQSGKKKIFTLAAVVGVFLILVWSVVLGYKRRGDLEVNKKIQTTKELITLQLSQAEEVGFLNMSRSLALIEESKQEVEKLKKELGKTREKEINELEAMIKTQEGKIVKKEEKKYEEFFDLTVDAKTAKGSQMYLVSDTVSIIDKDRKIIYILSLTKKSLDKRTASEVKSASLVGKNQDDVFLFIKGDGVFSVNTDNKSKKIIDSDNDWGEIVGISLYQGNLYLLDRIKGDIYKYLATAGGFSKKSSYLKGEAGSVKNANSLAIDSSVYLGFEGKVAKFTSGVRDEFSTAWPEKEVNLTKIFTSADVEKVYGWDKKNGAIYILSKNGTYERQIKSSILTKAEDFVVYRNDAYILVKEKIYKIGLQ